MAEQRKDSRSAAALKVKYKSASVDEFVHQFGTDVSRSGIFVKTKSPLEAGALLKLELQLSNATAVIAGIGRVAWRRASSTDPNRPAGMGIKFIKLEPASQAIVDRIIGERGEQPSRFDQHEGAELARPSMDPPAPTPSLPAPEPKPAPAPAPAASKAAAPMTASAARAIAGSAAQRDHAPAAREVPLAASAQPKSTSAAQAQPAGKPRIGPTKAAIPSGLFANSPLVQTERDVPSEGRSSFFPPAPSHAGSTSGSSISSMSRSNASSSGSLRAPGSSPNARGGARGSLHPAPAPAPQKPGPKGVFGGAVKPSPLATSASGMLRPAQEISSSNLFGGRDALDEADTHEIERPAELAAPAPLERAADEDGMFATLDPDQSLDPIGSLVDEISDAPTARTPKPAALDRVSSPGRLSSPGGAPAPGPARVSREPAAMNAVDHLFDELEGDAEPATAEQKRPSAAAAVFSPGSTHPSAPPESADDLVSDFDQDEAEGEGEEDLEQAAENDETAPRLLEQAAAEPDQKPRSTGLVLLVILGVLIAAAAAVAFLQPQLLVKLGLVQGSEAAVTASPLPTTPAAPAPTAPAAPPAEPVPAAAPTAAAAAAAPSAAPAEPAPTQAAADPTAAAPTGPAEMVSVNVTALPRGAEVRVTRDGVTTLAGVAPTNIDLPIGREVTVVVSAQGYTALSKNVTAEAKNEPLRFKLEPISYVLVVRSPAGATVAVGDATAVSPEPLALGHLSGDLEVSISKDGFRKMTRPVRLEEFVEKDGVLRAEIDVSLSPMPTTTTPSPDRSPLDSIGPVYKPRNKPRPRASSGGSATEAPPQPAEPEASAAPKPEPAPEAKQDSAPAPPKPPAPPTPPTLPE